jgi:hypothetical protein
MDSLVLLDQQALEELLVSVVGDQLGRLDHKVQKEDLLEKLDLLE